MSSTLAFTKMHGLGNDFVVIDDLFGSTNAEKLLDDNLARRLCDRRFGIGADQILWIRKSSANDAIMEIVNADGSRAEMCGNGIRAVALYMDRRSKNRKPEYAIETLGGLIRVRMEGDDVAVDMGKPGLGQGLPKAGERILAGGKEFRFYEVSMGNPHAVIFVPDVLAFPVEEFGPKIENHERFPKRTNVEFVQLPSRGLLVVRVWERGAGITLACGTGACASAVAAIATGQAENSLKVRLPGGDLKIEWQGPGYSVLMTGPATEVFSGQFKI